MAFVIPAYPQVKRVIKQSLVFASFATALALASNSAVCAKKPLTAVADLRYGVALYNYYQDQNLEALTELLVAKKKGGIQGHGDNPEIMEGGFSMAYGMERKASEIFMRLLTANRPQKTRDAAWFNLAKMRYDNQDWSAAEAALAQMGGKAAADTAKEIEFLRFNLALRQEHLEDAESLISRSNPWRAYMHFNMGSAYSNIGDYDKGITHYRSSITKRSQSPEFLALNDKALTAAAYAYMLKEDYPAATDLFARVRIDSPFSSRALLGYGWAAAEQQDYQLALKPWSELSTRKLLDENTQEALIAIPFAYEKLNRPGLAIHGFQDAENHFLDEILVLDGVIQTMPDYAIRDALDVARSTDINMLDYAAENSLSPRLSYLVELFSRDDFLGLVQQLRDLLAIQKKYQEWQDKLGFYLEMINEREQNRAQQVDFVVQQDLSTKISHMQQRRDAFAEEIAALQKDQSFLNMVDVASASKVERILNAEKNIQLLTKASIEQNMQVMPKEELETLTETVRKQKGFMVWHSQEMYQERIWRAKYALAQVNEALLSLAKLQSSVQSIVSQGQDLQNYKNQIGLATQKLTLQSTNINQEVEYVQSELRRKVLHVLQLHRVRLKHYLAQSRLSVARLLDQAAGIQIPVVDKANSEQQSIEEEPTTSEDKQTETEAAEASNPEAVTEEEQEANQQEPPTDTDDTNSTGDTL